MRIPSSCSHGFSSRLKSKFEASLYPISSEEEVTTLIASFKKEYPKADHYPYAFILGGKSKSSDDGEPSGTAGRAYLELLNGKEIDRALLICARYFGGTKLGVGNLRREFVEAGKFAIESAKFLIPTRLYAYSLEVDYPHYESLKRLAPNYGIEILNVSFGEQVSLTLSSRDKLYSSWEKMGMYPIALPECQTIETLLEEKK